MNMRPIPSSAPTAPPPTAPPPTAAPSAASNASSNATASTNSTAGPSADPDEIFMLLNGTIGAWLECYVEHALCDISSCTRNADGYSASCGCIRRSNADAATLALGWPSGVLATDGTYIATLHDYFNRSDEADGTAMCKAIAGGSVWPDADLVSLWSQNPYVSDDQINSDETTCDAAEGSYGANCMGAPCYDVPYNSTPNVFNVTCVCPVKEFSSLSVSSVRDDVCKTASANTSCAVVTGQYWRYKEYTKMTEAIAKVSSAAADPKPNECRNDCDECVVRDGDDDDDEVPVDELQYYYYSTGYKVPADDHTPDIPPPPTTPPTTAATTRRPTRRRWGRRPKTISTTCRTRPDRAGTRRLPARRPPARRSRPTRAWGGQSFLCDKGARASFCVFTPERLLAQRDPERERAEREREGQHKTARISGRRNVRGHLVDEPGEGVEIDGRIRLERAQDSSRRAASSVAASSRGVVASSSPRSASSCAGSREYDACREDREEAQTRGCAERDEKTERARSLLLRTSASSVWWLSMSASFATTTSGFRSARASMIEPAPPCEMMSAAERI